MSRLLILFLLVGCNQTENPSSTLNEAEIDFRSINTAFEAQTAMSPLTNRIWQRIGVQADCSLETVDKEPRQWARNCATGLTKINRLIDNSVLVRDSTFRNIVLDKSERKRDYFGFIVLNWSDSLEEMREFIETSKELPDLKKQDSALAHEFQGKRGLVVRWDTFSVRGYFAQDEKWQAAEISQLFQGLLTIFENKIIDRAVHTIELTSYTKTLKDGVLSLSADEYIDSDKLISRLQSLEPIDDVTRLKRVNHALVARASSHIGVKISNHQGYYKVDDAIFKRILTKLLKLETTQLRKNISGTLVVNTEYAGPVSVLNEVLILPTTPDEQIYSLIGSMMTEREFDRATEEDQRAKAEVEAKHGSDFHITGDGTETFNERAIFYRNFSAIMSEGYRMKAPTKTVWLTSTRTKGWDNPKYWDRKARRTIVLKPNVTKGEITAFMNKTAY